MVTVLNNTEVENLLDMGTCLTAMEEAYGDLGAGRRLAGLDLTSPIKVNSWSFIMAPRAIFPGEREKRRKLKKNRPRSRRFPLHPFLRSQRNVGPTSSKRSMEQTRLTYLSEHCVPYGDLMRPV